MTPVDLNRLREAINDDTVWDTAKAVLDAPTVWWCANRMEGFNVPHACCASDHGCGPVNLVPVKGES